MKINLVERAVADLIHKSKMNDKCQMERILKKKKRNLQFKR